MPDEYARSVLPPEHCYRLSELVPSRSVEGRLEPHPVVHTINRNAIVALTGTQLRDLHDSDEYREYREAISILRDPVHPISEMDRERAERALDAYLTHIAVTLKPIRGRYRNAIRMVAGSSPAFLAAAVVVFLNEVAPDIAESASKVVEIFARAVSAKAYPALASSRLTDELPSTFRLGGSIAIYLR